MPAQDPDAFVRSKEKSPNHESNSGLCPEPWAKKDAGLWRVRPDSGIRKGAERDLTTGPCLYKGHKKCIFNTWIIPGCPAGAVRIRNIFADTSLPSIRIVFEATGAVCGLRLFQIKNV